MKKCRRFKNLAERGEIALDSYCKYDKLRVKIQ